MQNYSVLDVNDNLKFNYIYETLNTCFGTNYLGWMQACWPDRNGGNLKFRVWFPKLAEERNGVLSPAAFNCLNTISADGNEFVFDDLKNQHGKVSDHYQGYNLIFAKEPCGGPYIFRGVYVIDKEKSAPNHGVFKRVGTRVALIGNPVFEIKIQG